jgi:hypothetical protein
MPPESKTTAQLPQDLEYLFWDCDVHALDLGRHRAFIIRRILDQGDWEAIKWLRRTLGDAEIHAWLLRKSGAGLDPRKLRFWGLVLDLPAQQIDEWIRKSRPIPWPARCGP